MLILSFFYHLISRFLFLHEASSHKLPLIDELVYCRIWSEVVLQYGLLGLLKTFLRKSLLGWVTFADLSESTEELAKLCQHFELLGILPSLCSLQVNSEALYPGQLEMKRGSVKNRCKFLVAMLLKNTKWLRTDKHYARICLQILQLVFWSFTAAL